jgi:ribose transport system substrate-binding protein
VAVLSLVAVGAVSAGAARLVTWPTPAQEIAKSGNFTLPFCGTKPITLAVLDGYGVNAWSQESYTAVRAEAAKCKNVKVLTAAGGGDLQKSISDVSTMVAQGANAITIIPDFGQAQLQSLKDATSQGVKVVPWGANPGGANGTDFVSYVDWNDGNAGTLWAQWMAKALHGKGNVIYTGGPAGNPVGAAQLAAVVAVFKKYPGLKLLTGNKDWPVTNWDPATAQKVTSALLAKYPKIDGVISDYGTDALAAMRAFQAANRTPVPIATLDTNGLACLYQKLHKTDPAFQIATTSGHNWMGRIAARKAIAAAEGLPNQEPSRMALPFYEDTLHGKTATCVAGRSPDAYISNQLSTAQLSKYGKP